MTHQFCSQDSSVSVNLEELLVTTNQLVSDQTIVTRVVIRGGVGGDHGVRSTVLRYGDVSKTGAEPGSIVVDISDHHSHLGEALVTRPGH